MVTKNVKVTYSDLSDMYNELDYIKASVMNHGGSARFVMAASTVLDKIRVVLQSDCADAVVEFSEAYNKEADVIHKKYCKVDDGYDAAERLKGDNGSHITIRIDGYRSVPLYEVKDPGLTNEYIDEMVAITDSEFGKKFRAHMTQEVEVTTYAIPLEFYPDTAPVPSKKLRDNLVDFG